jgi:ABC-type lipoprotein export system ATPase subunit
MFHSRSRVRAAGPSGSGKTTLLDVLAGRKTAGTITGGILFGGTAPTRAFLRRFTAGAPTHPCLHHASTHALT